MRKYEKDFSTPEKIAEFWARVDEAKKNSDNDKLICLCCPLFECHEELCPKNRLDLSNKETE